ncbi:hypothetical protein HNV12_01840 [Methanococcoides sp. SA1]|nr:hypothetical protein [Methanococcoides sp. SA1]
MEQIKRAEEGGALIRMLPITEEYLNGNPDCALENIYDYIWFKEAPENSKPSN